MIGGLGGIFFLVERMIMFNCFGMERGGLSWTVDKCQVVALISCIWCFNLLQCSMSQH